MPQNIQQKLLDYQLKSTSDTLTSKSGLALFYEAAIGLGVLKNIEDIFPAPGSNRGIKAAEYIMPLALMFSGGGRTMEDIREIEMDQGLRTICGFNKIPGADAIGEWIRKDGQLKGMKKVNELLIKEMLCRSQTAEYTLDTDATLIETEKDCAEMNYKGFTSFSVLLSFLAELDLCVCSDYRNGAVHAGQGIVEQLAYVDNLLKSSGKKLKYFRSDSAGYDSKVINACQEREIIFTITADQDPAVRDTLKTLKDSDWKKLLDENGQDTGREYALAIHCMGKSKEPFTLIIQRWRDAQLELFKQNGYHYYFIATNDFELENEAHKIIWRHNKRGNSENYNKEMKSGFGMDYVPSRQLSANAVYFEIGVLAFNLAATVKRLFLGGNWITKTIATLRWQLIFVAGKVVEHGRVLLLKISENYLKLFQGIREQIKISLSSA